MSKPLLTTRAYWKGDWVDLWSIPHTLIGFIIAIGASLLSVEMSIAYGFTASLALAWEIFERITGIGASETPTNSLTDILLALVGFGLGFLFLQLVAGIGARYFFIALAVILWALVNFLGWLAHKHHIGILA